MVNALLSLPECEADCGAVAIRGSYCVEHAIACIGCQAFFSNAELSDGVCARCARLACAEALEMYASATCSCGSHTAVRQ